MSFEFLLPLIGAGLGAFWSLRQDFSKPLNLVFVNDENSISEISGELVKTMTDVSFKVVRLRGRSIAGKRIDELENDLAKLKTFFQRLSEFDVEVRIYSQRFEKALHAKNKCENDFLNAICARWESRLKLTFEVTHYLAIQTTRSIDDIDKVINEILSLMSDYTPNVLVDDDLTAFLSTFFNPTPQSCLCNSRITISKSGEISFETNGKETRRLIFGIRDFGTNVSRQIIESILSLPYSVSLMTHLKPMSKIQTLTDIRNRDIQANFGRKIENQSDKFKDIRTAIEDDTETMLIAEMSVHLNLKSSHEKTEAIEAVLGCFGSYGVRPVLERQFAMPMFWAQCPGRDIFNRELRITSSNVADLHPLIRCETGLSRCDWGDRPVCYFPSVPSGNPFGFTFHATAEDQAPPHCAVFAPTGSGKSVLLLHLISQAMAAYPDLSVYALDRDNGLTVYTEMAGGTYHQISQSGDICLNPFDCADVDETSLNSFLQILTSAETEDEKKDIRLFVSEMIKQPRLNRTMKAYAFELAPNGVFKEKLEKWVKGNTLNARLFNGNKDTLDMTASRLNVFGLDHIKDDMNAAAALFFYLFKKIEKNAQSGKPSLLIVDEAPTLLASDPLKSEIEKLLKTARKQRMAIFMAFQGTNDLKALNIKETILTNCHTRFFYDGCAGTFEEIEGFHLTESETDFVLTKGAKIDGAKRPILMQRNRVNVFLETDMSCLGPYLNAFKGGTKAVKLWDYAKRNSDNPTEYYLKHYGEKQ